MYNVSCNHFCQSSLLKSHVSLVFVRMCFANLCYQTYWKWRPLRVSKISSNTSVQGFSMSRVAYAFVFQSQRRRDKVLEWLRGTVVRWALLTIIVIPLGTYRDSIRSSCTLIVVRQGALPVIMFPCRNSEFRIQKSKNGTTSGAVIWYQIAVIRRS